MQRAMVEAVARRATPDAHHRRVGELTIEDRQHGLAVLLVERAERVMQQDPARLVQQQAGEGQALLLLQGQDRVPALLAIERGQQMQQADPLERGGDDSVVEGFGRSG